MFDFNDIAPLGHENPSTEAIEFLAQAKRDIDFAFQPIVDIHNGQIFGYEALLRGHEKMGESSIHAVFDRAMKLEILHRFDMMMRALVVNKFAILPRTHKTKLFYNLDNRIISSPDYFKGATRKLLDNFDLPSATLCLEISERHELPLKLAEESLKRYRGEAYSTAIDDFGAGYSGLQLLKDYQPDFIKIDRYFIKDIEKDKKQKLMVSTVTDLAHVLGIFVIAEGIETEEELAVCKEIGCDLAQGFHICRPHTEASMFQKQYPNVVNPGRRQGTKKNEDSGVIYENIEYRPPLRIDDSMETVFQAFRANKDLTFFPVINELGYPMGIVQENDLKEYTYSPFGLDLIANKGTGLNLRKFLTSCPVADIQSSAQSILENFSLSETAEGIILVKEFSYLGFLSAASLLRVINEINLAQARDSSPLTKLPGNSSIAGFVSDVMANQFESATLAYMDLDNFKAFNDAYGFRQGDRAILLFAELMRRHITDEDAFLAHVGGDDFFIGFKQKNFDEIHIKIKELLADFKTDVESFYDQAARDAGCIKGKDRHGIARNFPLMSCSAALLHLPENRDKNSPTPEDLDTAIASLKKQAKVAKTHIALFHF